MTISVTPGLAPATPQEQAAFDIATHMLPETFASIKRDLRLPEPYAIGRQTLEALVKTFKDQGFDLSPSGVNTFKEHHGLSNFGILAGVIGPTTANVYAAELLKAIHNSPSSGRHINPAGLSLVKEFEGCAKFLPDRRIAAYKDPIGIPTIGYGHTHGVYLGQVITLAQAEALLKQDLATFESGVVQAVKVTINDNQFSALVSFAFNLGLGNLRSSSLLKALNAGHSKTEVADLFGRYVNAGGRPLAGLVRRREAERKLFLA